MAEIPTFEVTALKFRPQSFSEVVGQEHITSTLRNAVRRNRLANAYLFSGPRGVGKTSTARILAKAVNCESPQDGEPCNDCATCKSITRGTCVDVIELDAASNRGIDEIRDLRENVLFLPSMARLKVYIIDEAHQLTKEAFNALLKTLEEPPPHTRFILATTEAEKMLETIVSRCQQYRFRPLSLEQIVCRLRICIDPKAWEVVPQEIREETLYMIARASDGGMRDAQSILDQITSLADETLTLDEVELVLGGVRLDTLLRITDASRRKEAAEVLDLVQAVYARGQDMGLLIRDLLAHFRNLMVARTVADCKDLIDLPADQIVVVREQARQMSLEDILHGIDILFEAERRLRFAGSSRAVAEAAVIRLAKMPSTVEIDALLGRENPTPPSTSRSVTPPHHTSQPPPSPVDVITVPPRQSPPVEPPPAATKPLSPQPHVSIQMDEVPDSDLIEALYDNWSNICHRAAEKDVRYGGYLAEAVPRDYRNGVLEFAIPEDFDYHRQQLSGKAAREVIKSVLWEVQGVHVKDLSFRSAPRTDPAFSKLPPQLAEEPGPAEKVSPEMILEAEPSVKELLDEFDGVILEVRDNPNA